MKFTAILFILLSASTLPTTNGLIVNQENNPLMCAAEALEQLRPNCRVLRVFDGTQVDEWPLDEKIDTARDCACQLLAMPWLGAFDDFHRFDNVHAAIDKLLQSDKFRPDEGLENINYPGFLWSDVDVFVRQISIQHATHDFFKKYLTNRNILKLSRQTLRDPLYQDISFVCNRISADKMHLYRYLENLQRLSPKIFFTLIDMSDVINTTYQASKACKMLLEDKVDTYELRPRNPNFVVADQHITLDPKEERTEISNEINDYDNIDTVLRHASVSLMKCNRWQKIKVSLEELGQMCPLITGAHLPLKWIDEMSHKSLNNRTREALNCGCQLLLHNASWVPVMQNENVLRVSKAITHYMNQIKFPDIKRVPIWAFHGWFKDTMRRFEDNKKMSVKAIVNYKHQDPTQPFNKARLDEAEALEVLRAACNLVMFKSKPRGVLKYNEVTIIQHLDNLNLMSVDPQFVFHLALQDNNLFKLYTLTKMCKPVVK